MALPKGWRDHREFLRRVGARIEPGWTGAEHMAWPRSQYERDIAALDDDAAERVYESEVQAGIDQACASPQPPAAGGPACVTCGGPATKVIDAGDYCPAHGEPLTIPEKLRAKINRGMLSSPAGKEEIAEAGREVLLAKLDVIHAPERLARERWNRVHAAVRDKVFAGEVRWAAFCHGELHFPVANELRSHYPGPRELHATLPRLVIPARIVFCEADVTVFPAAATAAVPQTNEIVERKKVPPPAQMMKEEIEAFIKRKNSAGERVTLQNIATEMKRVFPGNHCSRRVLERARLAYDKPYRGATPKSPPQITGK